VLKRGEFVIPAGLLDLFREKANHTATALEGLSPVQAEKIEDHIMKNLDRFRQSDQFRSIVADAELFGEQAVIRKDTT
jgi:hypothetical protein